jgi:hypothetical protein
MNRTLSLVMITAFLFTVSACGEKKPPDPSALKSKNVLSVLRDMAQSYEKKALDSFMSSVADGYPERESFSSALASIFANYEAIHFNIQYTKMNILVQDRGPIKVSCNWDAEWLASKGTSQKSGGRITFAFDPGNFKLVAIEGKNPFIPTESTVKQ